MAKFTTSGKDAGDIAARVLSEWKSQPKGALRRELARVQELARQVPPSSSLEMEKIEVLLGAIESLQSDKPERIQAALYVLEHLASAGPSK